MKVRKKGLIFFAGCYRMLGNKFSEFLLINVLVSGMVYTFSNTGEWWIVSGDLASLPLTLDDSPIEGMSTIILTNTVFAYKMEKTSGCQNSEVFKKKKLLQEGRE